MRYRSQPRLLDQAAEGRLYVAGSVFPWMPANVVAMAACHAACDVERKPVTDWWVAVGLPKSAAAGLVARLRQVPRMKRFDEAEQWLRSRLL